MYMISFCIMFNDNLLLAQRFFHIIPLDLFVSSKHRQHCMSDASRFDSSIMSPHIDRFTCDLLHALSATIILNCTFKWLDYVNTSR